jgi:hypothetical protein
MGVAAVFRLGGLLSDALCQLGDHEPVILLTQIARRHLCQPHGRYVPIQLTQIGAETERLPVLRCSDSRPVSGR